MDNYIQQRKRERVAALEHPEYAAVLQRMTWATEDVVLVPPDRQLLEEIFPVPICVTYESFNFGVKTSVLVPSEQPYFERKWGIEPNATFTATSSAEKAMAGLLNTLDDVELVESHDSRNWTLTCRGRLKKYPMVPICIKIHAASRDTVMFPRRECIAASHSSHPNIAEMYGLVFPIALDRDDTFLLVSFHQLVGRDLTGVVSQYKEGRNRGGSDKFDTIVDVLEQCLDALAHLHAGGNEHGDLKPSKLVWGLFETSRVLLTDLGGIKELPTNRGLIPHEFQRDHHQFHAQALGDRDVYALGVILRQLLYGRSPIRNDTLEEAVAACRQGFNETVPADWIAALSRIVFYMTHPDVRKAWTSLQCLAAVVVLQTATRDNTNGVDKNVFLFLDSIDTVTPYKTNEPNSPSPQWAIASFNLKTAIERIKLENRVPPSIAPSSRFEHCVLS